MNQEPITQFDTTDPSLPVWYRLDYSTRTPAAVGDTLLPAGQPLTGADSSGQSFFTTQGAIRDHATLPVKVHESDWLYGSFAVILFMIVLVRIFFASEVNKLLRTYFFPGKGKSEERVFEFRFDMFTLLFLLIYSLTFGLMLLSMLQEYHWVPDLHSAGAMKFFFLFSLSFLALILGKLILVKISGFIFSTMNASQAYQDQLMISAFIASTLIIPLIVINTFSSSSIFLFLTGALLIILLIIRMVRVVKIGFTLGSYSYLHFILYLCTLEIVPIAIIGKIILDLLMKQG